jgi:hypothetical protein
MADPVGERGFWASVKAWARVKHEDLSRWRATFRFSTDCTDTALLEGVRKRALQSSVIREVRLLPGRRGAIHIEVEITENHDAGRARSARAGQDRSLTDGLHVRLRTPAQHSP